MINYILPDKLFDLYKSGLGSEGGDGKPARRKKLSKFPSTRSENDIEKIKKLNSWDNLCMMLEL